MIKNIEIATLEYDWKSQLCWWVDIANVLGKIERWEYKTKKVKLNIEHINLTEYNFTVNDLFDFMIHYKLVENASLDFPIIINKKWIIFDWRHRLCKAILAWHKTIDAIMVLDSNIFIKE